MCEGLGVVGHAWYKIFQGELKFCGLRLIFSLTLDLHVSTSCWK